MSYKKCTRPLFSPGTPAPVTWCLMRNQRFYRASVSQELSGITVWYWNSSAMFRSRRCKFQQAFRTSAAVEWAASRAASRRPPGEHPGDRRQREGAWAENSNLCLCQDLLIVGGHDTIKQGQLDSSPQDHEFLLRSRPRTKVMKHPNQFCWRLKRSSLPLEIVMF